MFEEKIKSVYTSKSNKFIERHYIRALLLNKKYTDLINVVQKSQYINEELKQEIRYRIDKKQFDCAEVVSNIIIRDLKTAITKLNEIETKKNKILYEIYIKQLLGIR